MVNEDHSFHLGPGDVHVWQVRTDRPEPDLAGLHDLLAAAERERAARFKFAEHRRRYIVAHGALRQILAGYLDLDPTQLEFREGAQGKPHLVLAANQLPLQFNLSHSHEAALVAVALAQPIGIDVEYIKADFDWRGIVENYFAAGEIAKLNALPAALQKRAFFTIWTRKEAYIKAKGGGLSIPLDGFEVAVHPSEAAALLSCANDPQEVARWSMTNLDVDFNYAATLCAAMPLAEVKLSTWTAFASLG